MDMRHGNAAWTGGMDMQVYISKTSSRGVRCSIVMGMQHRRSAGKCSKSKEIKHVQIVCKYMLHGHAARHVAWRSGTDAAGHASLK